MLRMVFDGAWSVPMSVAEKAVSEEWEKAAPETVVEILAGGMKGVLAKMERERPLREAPATARRIVAGSMQNISVLCASLCEEEVHTFCAS